MLGDLPGSSPWELLGAVGANHGGAGIRVGISLLVDNISQLYIDITVAVTLVQTAVVAAIFLDGAQSCGHHPNLQPVRWRFCV